VMDAAKPTVWAKLQDAVGRKPPPPAVRHLPTPYPHIVLWKGEHMWTSVHLALIKPER
jgi:hypothetical protein